MAAKLFVLFSCIAFSQAAIVRREAQAAKEVKEVEKLFEEFQNTLSDKFAPLINSKSTDIINQAFIQSADSLLEHLVNTSTSLHQAMTDVRGKAKGAVQATRHRLERTAQELRHAYPEVQSKSFIFREKLEEAVHNTAISIQRLAKRITVETAATNESLAPTIKETYQKLVDLIQDIQKKLQGDDTSSTTTSQ